MFRELFDLGWRTGRASVPCCDSDGRRLYQEVMSILNEISYIDVAHPNEKLLNAVLRFAFRKGVPLCAGGGTGLTNVRMYSSSSTTTGSPSKSFDGLGHA